MTNLPPFANAISGALGAIISNTLVYPLDVAKTRLQVQNKESAKSTKYKGTIDALKQIYKEEGIQGLYWNGLGANWISTASSQFSYFYFYGLLRPAYEKRYAMHYGKDKMGTLWELLLGAHAAALGQLFTIPVVNLLKAFIKSVIATRQQTTRPAKDFHQTMIDVLNEDGITGLWKGLKPSLILVINPSITYAIFEKLKHWYMERFKKSPNALLIFWMGAISKTLATILTYPYIMSKVRLQWKCEENNENLQYKGAIDVMRKVYKSEGFRGLFKGLNAQIVKAVLCQALLLTLKTKLDLYSLILYTLVHNMLHPK
ncbi:Mitochondrial substrate/solute carrier domain-containing protein [Rozella allomycis CSF55]|uniref:Mitochondrial substrate/solute carrier domain-containing protein n=1 Tax=Rozella allomycis (strain CSF55) TaxID=988480 RepID=A0A075AP29_ROZAC|nr:Mitochondrial substrate/solute carrier domain-containing protein [Rozella allomycis CSF55]|eukprot:EPZ31694.1 Mitochondrial substrate/solute carrier domain-containing protein [Rozella allomycis CSF55]